MLFAALSLAIFGACGPSSSGGAPSGQDAGAPSSTAASSTSATPAKVWPAIRDNTAVGPFQSGAALEVRAFVSRLTPTDPILIAVKLRPEKPLENGHPWLEETIDLTGVLPNLRFEVKGPTGTHTLSVQGGPQKPLIWKLADFRQAFALSGENLTLHHAHSARDKLVWSTPVPTLLEKPGKYTVTITGDFKTSTQTLALTSKPLEVEVIEAAGAQKPLAELEAIASKIANKGNNVGPFSPMLSRPPVDDVEHNRSFELRNIGLGYEMRVAEVLLDPSGKQLYANEFEHFTCVAEGTLIQTPNGNVPIESLKLGQQVSAMEPSTGEPRVAEVLQIARSRAAQTYRFGDLRVTGSHPLFADGHWVRADEIAPGMSLVSVDGTALEASPTLEHAHVTVYDISVTDPHTYFAGGVLVHNKAFSTPLHHGAAWGGWFSRGY